MAPRDDTPRPGANRHGVRQDRETAEDTTVVDQAHRRRVWRHLAAEALRADDPRAALRVLEHAVGEPFDPALSTLLDRARVESEAQS